MKVVREETVVRLRRPPANTWPCPSCHGLGHRCDGGMSISEDEVRIKRPTPCAVCKGIGRVRVTAIEKE